MFLSNGERGEGFSKKKKALTSIRRGRGKRERISILEVYPRGKEASSERREGYPHR